MSGIALAEMAGVPEPFKAIGLHQAMFIIPALGTLLAAVLFAGAVTVKRDIRKLHDWMENCPACSSESAGN